VANAKVKLKAIAIKHVIFGRVCKIVKSVYQLCQFVRMEQLGSHWIDCGEI